MSTLYIITPTTGDDTINPFINILPGALNGPGGSVVGSDLRLYGQGTTLYGEGVNENLYRLTESFACPEKAGTPGTPQDQADLGTGNGVNTPLTGQPWYNTTTKKLLTYDASVGNFINTAAPAFGGTEPSAPIEGDLWYDNSHVDPLNHQLKVYEGTAFVSVALRYVALDGTSEMYGNLTVASTAPAVRLRDTGAAADEQLWRFVSVGGQFRLNTQNDDESVSDNVLTIDRAGSTVDNITIRTIIKGTETPTDIDHLTRKDYVDDNFVADVGGTMSGALVINSTLDVNGVSTLDAINVGGDITVSNTFSIILPGMVLNVGDGSIAAGPDIEINAAGLIAADNGLYFNIDTGNVSSGDFIVSKGANVIDGSETALFTIENTGRIKSNNATYELLVTTDDTLTNKKYVDDEISAATGALGTVPEIWTTLSASAKQGDIAIVSNIIYINLSAGSNFKQVWPAVYT